MKLTFTFLFLAAITTTFAQKGFDKKSKPAAEKNEVPQGQFIEIQGEKNDKNSRYNIINAFNRMREFSDNPT